MPNVGDILEWNGAAFTPCPVKVSGFPAPAGGAPGNGSLLVYNNGSWSPVLPSNGVISNGTQITLDTTYAAESLEGDGLERVGSELRVYADEVAGTGLLPAGTRLSVDYDLAATTLEGNGLTRNGNELDVDPGKLAGTALTQENGNTRLGVNVAQLAGLLEGDGLTAQGTELLVDFNIVAQQIRGSGLAYNAGTGNLDVARANAVAPLDAGAATTAQVAAKVNEILTELKAAGLMSN